MSRVVKFHLDKTGFAHLSFVVVASQQSQPHALCHISDRMVPQDVHRPFCILITALPDDTDTLTFVMVEPFLARKDELIDFVRVKDSLRKDKLLRTRCRVLDRLPSFTR